MVVPELERWLEEHGSALYSFAVLHLSDAVLTCKQASRLVSARQDRKLGLRERVGLRWHLWLCGDCRRFERQIA